MSTASFDKRFVVSDPKAIEQFLGDLERAKQKPTLQIEPTQDEIKQKHKLLALLKQKMGKS
ncbi:hypothetical protein B0181_06005 [Moraxella caviae]|uniref:Uncharacterized protein n=1 Tax=Moraxella caviae TaxID=34060 RepID=A0A1T0A361_9GAMM|nr:hypothetical protein [Moraxella caviae]OOR89761.1 hypothetical protein B0181_06005 [Moraxella caviae]STZ10700.1 Uncharacterised protein [Moraxella caviae]